MTIAQDKQPTVAELLERLDALTREVSLLREENAALKRGIFGRRSERVEQGQLGLFQSNADAESVEADAPASPKPKQKKAKSGRGRGMTPENESRAYESPTARFRAQWTQHGTTKTLT